MASWLENPVSQMAEDLKISPTFSISSSYAIPNGKEGAQHTSSHNSLTIFQRQLKAMELLFFTATVGALVSLLPNVLQPARWHFCF